MKLHRPLDWIAALMLCVLISLPLMVARSCGAKEGTRLASEAVTEVRKAVDTAEVARDYAYSLEASVAALEESTTALASELASATEELERVQQRYENAVITIDALELENGKLKQQKATVRENPAAKQVSGSVERWRPLVARYFPANAVDDALVCIKRESGGNPNAVNRSSGCAGLFQLMPPHNGWNPLDPENNVRIAAKLYRQKGWSPWTTM